MLDVAIQSLLGMFGTYAAPVLVRNRLVSAMMTSKKWAGKAALAVTLAAAISALPMASAITIDDTQELLRLAREKSEIATRPDAFGNGVPIFKDGFNSALPLVGIAAGIGVAGMIVRKKLSSCKEGMSVELKA